MSIDAIISVKLDKFVVKSIKFISGRKYVRLRRKNYPFQFLCNIGAYFCARKILMF